jgi:flagellar basal-body rod modification protein FlgD
MTTPAVGSPEYYASIGITNPAPARRGGAEVGENDFLRLMLEQLRNQDPLNPEKGAEFVAQLAQFSTVSGIEKLSAGFGELVDSLRGSQALSAAALVGGTALVEANRFTLDAVDEGAAGKPAGASGSKPADADLPRMDSAAAAPRGVAGAVDVAARGPVTVEVVNAAGNVVHSIPLGTQEAGLAEFAWDGRLPNGQPAPAGEYTVRARLGEKSAPVLLEGRIRSVSVGAQGAMLALEGIGSFPVNGVRRFG